MRGAMYSILHRVGFLYQCSGEVVCFLAACEDSLGCAEFCYTEKPVSSYWLSMGEMLGYVVSPQPRTAGSGLFFLSHRYVNIL